MTCLTIAGDGAWLATSDLAGTVRIWAPDGVLRATMTGGREVVICLAIAPDGTWLATGDMAG